MTETVTSLLPFRTTMPVLLAGYTRHSERPSLSGGGAGGYRLYGIPRRHGAVPPCFRLGMGDRLSLNGGMPPAPHFGFPDTSHADRPF